MSQYKRIRSLMMISEQEQKPVTAPVNIEKLVSALNYLYNIDPSFIDDITTYENLNLLEDDGVSGSFLKSLEKTIKLFGISKLDYDELDFIGEFMVINKGKLITGNTDKSNYIIPKSKTYRVIGDETYSARKSDRYELIETAYNPFYLKYLIEQTSDLELADGTLKGEDWYDTWDVEQEVDTIEEIETGVKMNEDIETDEVQPEIKSEDFIDFVNGEYDIETLELMQSVISGRVRKLKSLIDIANRKEIKGYRK